MKKGKAVDWNRIMSCLAGRTAESFPFERHLTLIEILAWIGKPNDLDWMDLCRRTAAGTCLVELEKGKLSGYKTEAKIKKAQAEIVNALFPPAEIGRLAFRLSNDYLFSEFDDRLWETHELTAVLYFLVRFPKEKKGTKRPSLNKAWRFIEDEGWGKDEVEYSAAKLKTLWPTKAIALPFLAAFDWEDIDYVQLGPVDPGLFGRLDQLLADPEFGLRLLRQARTFQEHFIDRLDPMSKKRFSFVKFPDYVTLIDLNLTELLADEMLVIDKYKAPKAI